MTTQEEIELLEWKANRLHREINQLEKTLEEKRTELRKLYYKIEDVKIRISKV